MISKQNLGVATATPKPNGLLAAPAPRAVVMEVHDSETQTLRLEVVRLAA